MRRSTARPHESGFLLADMLVTLTISAFLLAGLVAIGSVLLRTADRSVARIEATDDLSRTLTTLAHAIRSATRARFAGVEPQPFVFNGDGRRLMFAHPDTTPDRPPITRMVALQSTPDGRLMRAEAALPASAESLGDVHFGAPHVSYAGPARIRFGYVGPPGGGEAAKRVSSWPVGPHMPSMVAIEAFDPVTNRILASLQVMIGANAEVGCIDGGFCGRGDLPPKAAPAPSAQARPQPPPAAVAGQL